MREPTSRSLTWIKPAVARGVKMTDQENNSAAYRWAGPVLFIKVCVLIAVFFWWFVQA